MVKVTRSQSLNECGYYLSLLEISLGKDPFTLEISNQEDDLKIVHMEDSKIIKKQPPFNFITTTKSGTTEIKVQRKSDLGDVKLLVYHKSERLNITNENVEYEVDLKKSDEKLRIDYAREQPSYTISHKKQDECLHLLEKADDIYELNKINILYVGPDELLNVKCILNYLIEEKGIKKKNIMLDVATSNLSDPFYSDREIFVYDNIEGVKIRNRIPHTKFMEEQHSNMPVTPEYDLIVDCFTFPVWFKEQIKITLEHRMSSLNPSGYFLFVTPSSTKDSLFFKPDDEDYEDLFEKNWISPEDLTENIVIKRDDSENGTNIYAALIQSKQTNNSPSSNNQLLAKKILKFSPLLNHVGEPTSIDLFSLPTIIDENSEQQSLEDIIETSGSKKIVISGIGGVGKSTSAKYLASLAFTKFEAFPLILCGHQLDKIIEDELGCVEASIPNLFQFKEDDIRESYINSKDNYRKILLIFDQLDDLNKDEYPNKLNKIINEQIKNEFPNFDIQNVVMFARKEIPMHQSVRFKVIVPELNEIVESIVQHNLGINDSEARNNINLIKNQGYKLVRADIPFLVEYISKEIKESGFTDNYGFFKVRIMTRIMRETVTDMNQFNQSELDRLLSIFFNYMYHSDKPTPIDRIYQHTKKVFPQYIEDDLAKIIVASRQFSVSKDAFYSISAHDTVRDLLCAQFYSHPGLATDYIQNGLYHALNIDNIHDYDEKTTRILNSFYELCRDRGESFVECIFEILEQVCKGKIRQTKQFVYDDFILPCIDKVRTIDENDWGKNNARLPYLIWKFFEFNQDEEYDRSQFVGMNLSLFNHQEIHKIGEEIKRNARQGKIKAFTVYNCIEELKEWFVENVDKNYFSEDEIIF